MRCLHSAENLTLPRCNTRCGCEALALRPCKQCSVAKVDAEEAPEAAEGAGPSPRTRQVAPDSRVGWGGASSPFYKVEAFGKHILSVQMESRQAVLSCADQQNAAVGALQERCHERSPLVIALREHRLSTGVWGALRMSTSCVIVAIL
jgi:hypothetical protein